MKDLIVDIWLWGKPVGSLIWDDQRDIAVFEFDSGYRRNGSDLSPLKLPTNGGRSIFSFPENRNNCFKGLPGFVADALPDKFGDQIITEWLLRNGFTELAKRFTWSHWRDWPIWTGMNGTHMRRPSACCAR